MLRRNRFVNAGINAGKVTAAATSRAARKLWLEVTGFLFAIFALTGAAATLREYRATGDWQRIALGILFTAVFTFFSLSSILSSRRARS